MAQSEHWVVHVSQVYVWGFPPQTFLMRHLKNMKLKTVKSLLLFSFFSLLSATSFAENMENIFVVEELSSNSTLQQFQKIEVLQSYNNASINLNPLPYINISRSEENGIDGNPLAQNKNSEVESIYIGIRRLNTQVPVQIFNNDAFKNANIQSELFKNVSFTGCTVDHCNAKQSTLLGPARYEMVYKFLTENELSQLHIPESLLSKAEQQSVKFALVQNAYNWNDFFSSGFNLILIKEDAGKNAQIVAFQAFLLTPHFISDAIYVNQISGTLDSQIKTFISALNKYKNEWQMHQRN